MYPFKILNKKKYAICFLNAFLENICLYLMPIVLSIYLTVPFTLDKFKMLIILTITLKALEILFNVIWNVKTEPFLENTKKDLQISYFKRICNLNISKLNNTHTGFLKKQIDVICDENSLLLDELMMTINGFGVAITIFLIQVARQNFTIFLICIIFIILIVIYNIVITKSNVIIQEDYNNKYANYNATNVDFIENVKVVKNYDTLKFAIFKMNSKFDYIKRPLRKNMHL